jgi:hypothetical protein
LAQHLRVIGFEVVTAATGETAFHLLRDWQHPIGWLYTRADLPGLIDGWILADEYHDSHAGRAAIIAAPEARTSRQDDIILQQPSLTTVLDTLRHAIESDRSKVAAALSSASEQQRAA